MKRLALTVTLILVLVMAASVVLSQDDEIILQHDEFGDRSRPPVTFSHLTHADLINCSVCHHSYMLIDNADASDGVPLHHLPPARGHARGSRAPAHGFSRQLQGMP